MDVGVEIVAFLSRFSKNVVVSTSILQEKANKTESQFVRVVWLLGSLLEVHCQKDCQIKHQTQRQTKCQVEL